MDQKFVAGLGNIYVNEILFASGINPFKKINKIKNYDILKILSNTKSILKNQFNLVVLLLEILSTYLVLKVIFK